MKAFVLHSAYICPDCGYYMQVESLTAEELVKKKGKCVIFKCSRNSCKNFDKKFRCNLPIVDIEEVK